METITLDKWTEVKELDIPEDVVRSLWGKFCEVSEHNDYILHSAVELAYRYTTRTVHKVTQYALHIMNSGSEMAGTTIVVV